MGSTNRLLRQFTYALREASRGLWRGGLMSFLVISTMMVALSVLGGFWLLISDITFISNRVASQLQIVVFLTNDTDLDALAPKIERLEGVASIAKISKQEAKVTMMEEIPDVSELLENSNPFPDAIEVTVNEPSAMEDVVNQLKEIEGVEEIQYNQELAEQIRQVKSVIQMVGGVMATVLGIATLALVFNTIYLAVHSRRDEIEIMRLVGASNWFIRLPFVLEGVLFGAASSVLAGLLLVSWRLFSVLQIKKWFQFLPMQTSYDTLIKVALAMVPIGIGLGILGSVLSIQRYLRQQPAEY